MIGLVLGAGGVVGGAFHAGLLAALAERTGWDPRQAEIMVGTSAGSATAAVLRSGLGAVDLAARAQGHVLSVEGQRLLADAAGAAPPTVPRRPPRGRGPWRMAAPSALAQMGLRPWNVRPGVLAAAVLPAGTASTDVISEGIDTTFGPDWPEQPLWITAVDLDSGRRVVFGVDGAPTATVGQAVAASCAIPAFFQPVAIDNRRYVDGGTHSLLNLDLVAGAGCSLVIVSSPMSAAAQAGLRGPDAVMRRLARAQLAREVALVRRAGVEVLAFQPTAEDLRTMGPDAMDADRRPVVVRSVYESTLRRLDRPDVQERLDQLR